MNEKSEGRVIRLGTRKSKLAMAQTMMVAEALKAAEPGLQVEIVPVVTTGDRILDRSLTEFGGKGVFISELEEGILEGRFDAAVHSAKDMPMMLQKGLKIAAVLPRDDARDVYITVKNREIKPPILVGTGSARRQMQIDDLKDVKCMMIRGNIDTRLEKLYSGEYDAIILAAAGLERLNLLKDERFEFEYLPTKKFVPAGGQGIIAIEAKTRSKFSKLFDAINHEPTALALEMERAVMNRIGLGCNAALGVYSYAEGERLFLQVVHDAGSSQIHHETEGMKSEWKKLVNRIVKASVKCLDGGRL